MPKAPNRAAELMKSQGAWAPGNAFAATSIHAAITSDERARSCRLRAAPAATMSTTSTVTNCCTGLIRCQAHADAPA